MLLWARFGDRRLGAGAREVIARAWERGEVAVSAMTFWEIAMLHDKGRIALPHDIAEWRAYLLEAELVEIPVDGEIGIRAIKIDGLHGDPADRVIVATALSGHRLLTADRLILEWAGPLDRLSAAE